jgi:eukaryotic-like serine/threonine-protein kinase
LQTINYLLYESEFGSIKVFNLHYQKNLMLIGTVLGNHYQIIKLLGSGGFGDTYLAEDLHLPDKPKCVVKHLKLKIPDPAVLPIAQRLFDSEANVLYRLNDCEQIPKLFAHFQEGGEFYLVQEFVDGEDLGGEMSPGRKLNESEVKQLLQEILEVLAVVHKRNMIHRDIKPQNLMRRRDGKIILIDFGAVKETMSVNAQGQTSATVTIGTAGYMPSEQATGYPKLCSDIHAVGMLGVYALTGIQPHELPKDPTNGEVIWRNWTNISEDFANILTKMVRYHFSERYQTATEVLEVLKPSVSTKPPKPKPSKPQSTNNVQPVTNNPSRRRFIQTAGWVSAGVGLAVVGGRLLGNSSQEQPGSLDITPTSTPEVLPTSQQPNSPTPKQLQSFKFETVTVNAKGAIANRRNQEAKYFVEDLGNGVTLEMVQIPGGTFTMGSPVGEAKRSDDEGPQHQVKVPGFYMGRYEVTQAQYQGIMGSNPANFKGEKRPVEQVSWNDAIEFCKKLSQKTGRTYRLPSEAEWEYACRAGTTTPFYFGETITADLVNFDGNSTYASAPKGVYRQQTTEVGKFPPNAFGLYDMHGNVWEWCQDTYNKNYNGAPTDGSAWLTGEDNTRKLLRGGSWSNDPEYCRSASRDGNNRVGRSVNIGFRVVVVVA